MMRAFWWAVSVTVVIFSLPFSVIADSEEKPLRIATVALVPVGYKENGISKGLFYDIANRIAQRAGFSYVNTIKPYGRVVNDLKNGKSDASIFGYNPNLEGKAKTIAPIVSLKIVLIANRGSSIIEARDLLGKSVGFIRGSRFMAQQILDDAKELIPITDFKQGLKMLKANRFDVLVGSDLGLYSSMKLLGMKRSEFSQPYIVSSSQTYLYLSNHFADKKQIKRLVTAAHELKSTGEIDEILEKYLGN
ncbi:transporter substrate-binding domain-containing protein [Vibrio profundum]|uniref:substrate-binding periplasmic protein n=1 Tax=Vibrio profundum TaxID=2910247 RepID=UPI003D14B26F